MNHRSDEKAPDVNDEEQPASYSDDDDNNNEELRSDEVQRKYAREFTVNHGDFPWRDFELLDGGGSLAYFCDVRTFGNKTPDCTLHRGGKTGPVVGASHYRMSRSITCGVGPDDISMKWTKMKHPGMFNIATFDFEWEGKKYSMRRAKGADFGGSSMQRFMMTHFKIVDAATGSIVALYVSETGVGKKKATLKIADGVSPDLEVLFILGMASWRDKIRRARAGSSGGGGGGG